MTDTRLDALAAVLPPPSPALRAHMAADRLRRAAQAALEELKTNDYWGGNWAAGMTDGMGGAGGTMAALLSPEVALEVADLLDAAGQKAVQRAACGGQPYLPDHVTRIVDHLLED